MAIVMPRIINLNIFINEKGQNAQFRAQRTLPKLANSDLVAFLNTSFFLQNEALRMLDQRNSSDQKAIYQNLTALATRCKISELNTLPKGLPEILLGPRVYGIR